MINFHQISQLEQQRTVVFLDIDDVLAVHRLYNTRQVLAVLAGDNSVDATQVWQKIFHAAARDNLRQLHEEFRPLYVISSSWTLHLTKEQFCETFRRTGMEFIAENFHQHWQTPRDEGNSYRLKEIELWLDTHALLTPVPFLVIDDVISGQSIPGSHLENRSVLCDAGVGLIFPKLKIAQKILRNQVTKI